MASSGEVAGLMTSSITVGIIAEDISDYECVKEILQKLCPEKQISFKKQLGKGCGTIAAKCNKWAGVLKNRGCTKLIILRDSDGKSVKKLEAEISKALTPPPIEDNVIVIAVCELENWLLADLASVHQTFCRSKKKPNEIHNPESISKAKEHLRDFVKQKYSKQYLSTTHNSKIAQIIDVSKIKKKCPSFQSLDTFVSNF